MRYYLLARLLLHHERRSFLEIFADSDVRRLTKLRKGLTSDSGMKRSVAYMYIYTHTHTHIYICIPTENSTLVKRGFPLLRTHACNRSRRRSRGITHWISSHFSFSPTLFSRVIYKRRVFLSLWISNYIPQRTSRTPPSPLPLPLGGGGLPIPNMRQ